MLSRLLRMVGAPLSHFGSGGLRVSVILQFLSGVVPLAVAAIGPHLPSVAVIAPALLRAKAARWLRSLEWLLALSTERFATFNHGITVD